MALADTIINSAIKIRADKGILCFDIANTLAVASAGRFIIQQNNNITGVKATAFIAKELVSPHPIVQVANMKKEQV